jgi:hypothetical protein
LYCLLTHENHLIIMKHSRMKNYPRYGSLLALSVSLAWSATATAADPVTGGDIPGTFKLPGTNTSVGFYGFADMYITKDFKATGTGNNSFFDGGSIGITNDPSGVNSDSRKGAMNMTAAASRFGFKTYTPTDIGKVSTVLEGDFLGSSSSVRLRHAYGVLDADWGSVLAGQTWSMFRILEAVPETLDFNGDGAWVGPRKPQVRYTTAPNKIGSFGVSFEMPAYSSSAVPNSVVKAPAVVAAWTKSGDFGTISIRGMANQIAYETIATANTGSTSKTRYGHAGSVGGSFNLGKADAVQALVTAGTGISQYIETANFNPEVVVNSEIEMPSLAAYSLGWTHKWSPTWRTNLNYTITQLGNDYANYMNKPENKRVNVGMANVIYQATKNFSVGMEFAYGDRKLTDGTKGTQERIATSFLYSF